MTSKQKYYISAVILIGVIYLVSKKPVLSPRALPVSTNPQIETASILDSNRYTPYTSENFENSKDKRRVLYFYANWCITCKPANADFLANEDKIPADVEVFRVNYKDTDTDPEEASLAKKYNITYQHTFVQVDSDGKEIKKWNGGDSKLLIEKLSK